MKDIFLTNDTKITFLEKLKESLLKCNKFYFSVSFIKNAGLILLKPYLEAALDKGVVGKIVTSCYQNFTDIPSLTYFLSLKEKYQNFDIRVDYHSFGESGFHTKGYMFEYDDSKELIVGSSNITRFALINNKEWDVSLENTNDQFFDSYDYALQEFDFYFNACKILNEDLIKKYSIELEDAVTRWDMDYFDPSNDTISPNQMQRRALKEIRRYRDLGQNKALVVSATGSGKTYLAAFDARNFGAKRVLFIVHRETILKDAIKTFSKVFGANKSYGLYSGSSKDMDVDFLFATNVSMSEHLQEFDPHEFDYICLDEAHHATAGTYRKIMEYFKPEFCLGLTATPERLDNEDVFKLFGKNVPYELRLRDAINNDLIVPFKYYGIRDTLINYDSNKINESKLAKEMTDDEHVDFVIKNIEAHPVNGKLKAIAFCTNIASASLMAEQFNSRGYNAISLSGSSDTGVRVKAFSDLSDEDNPLEIICTVDILNEGVDIPSVNMVLFLRPTESPVIFIQQLGRGLRRHPEKEFLTVLDFIGNSYKRATQIALALGSLGKNIFIDKRTIQDQVRNDFNTIGIKGVEIHIDALAKEEILDYISNTNFNGKDFIEQDYKNFKIYLKKENSYPSHMDYLNNDCAPDLLRFIKGKYAGKKIGSYYNFLRSIDDKNVLIFNDKETHILEALSSYLPLVRPDEYLIINQIVQDGSIDLTKLVGSYKQVNMDSLNNALYFLNKENVLSNGRLDDVTISHGFIDFLLDLLNYGITRFNQEFGDMDSYYKLYRNYTKDQIMRQRNLYSYSVMNGIEYDKINKYYYVYVGLKKDKDKIERTNYKDKFLKNNILQWESQNNTTFNNSKGKDILDAKKVFVFVRKMDSEDGITLPFTYFGTGTFNRESMKKSYVDTVDKNTGCIVRKDTLIMNIDLDVKVPEEYYYEFNIPSGDNN